ncbi:MAG TPA: EAL domain-containing protein [Steroidobacteraceae bacterium]|nr:EAL domain-containing protein [Steroidobacteraceae bacterium]
MGITGRLIFSFAAVAVLAAAANLIVEHGVAVIRTSHLDRGLISPRPLIPQRTAAPRVVETPPPAGIPADSPVLLAASIERYQRAAEVRASIDTTSAVAEAHAAFKNLDSVSKALQARAESSKDPGATLFGQRAKAYAATGNNYIELADARRSALDDYVACADAMDKRLTASLEGAWKIFGRVLARQSLMQLLNQLAEVRHGFAKLSAADGDKTDVVAAVATSEAAFSTTFESHAGAFSRSEGAAWVRQMRDDFAKIVGLRKSIVSLDLQSHEAGRKLENARTRLVEAIPKTGAPLIVPSKAAPAPAQTAREYTGPPMAPIASPVIDTVTTTTTTTGSGDQERRTIAWITAAVLAVLLAISISTVRSILVPVSRMLEATEQIAAGDVAVRVPKGGIRELDTLGAGFNRMAEQLAAARDMTRDYQLRLEEKVEQRTRQLQQLAEQDPLTHLPNRRQLFVLLNHGLERAAKNRRHVGVFFLDIDNFKNLNDSMGHAFGDQVLAGIAQRLKEAAQSFGFAGRLGGDEFTVVYEDALSIDVVLDAGRQLVDSFERPLVIDGREVMVRASVGASFYPNHGSRAEDLLSAADAALFQAKALGRSQLAIFSPELLAAATRKFTIEQGLRRAIEMGEFELVYQPEVSLDSLEVVLVESLVRWRLPDGRQAPPAEFLAVTEESGLIIEVGNWVLRKAIETASHWRHGEWPEARIAINVSPRQLLDRRFADYVLDLLREYDLPAHCIELELTESVLQNGPTTLESLRHLRSNHIAIALDDFGSGYSSLASLENLPLSRIKLDRTLIASIDRNSRSAAIATALINLCLGLGLDVTAEGVERPEQFAALAGYRSLHLQGYLIARPMAGDEVILAKRMMPRIMQDLLLSVPDALAKKQGQDSEPVRAMASGSGNG